MRTATRRTWNGTSRTDLAGDIKRLVPMTEAAEFYGFTPNRGGYIQCPFHSEKTGSLKIYPEDGGWHCFGCGEGGSVIDFVMKLFDLDFRQACLRLNVDFGLGLSEEAPDRAAVSARLLERRREQLRREKLEAEYRELAEEYRILWQAKLLAMPSETDILAGYIHPMYAEAVKKLPELEYRLDEIEDELGRRTEREIGHTKNRTL